MKFSDFIDLDRQLQVTEGEGGASARDRRERDRRIGRKLQMGATGSPAGDDALLEAWTKDVSLEAGPSLGVLLTGAVQWTAVLLAAFGLFAGAGAAVGLLRYDGTQPINVLFFLGAIVGVQLLLLPALFLGLLFRRQVLQGGRMIRSVVGALVTKILDWLARFGGSAERAAKLKADMGALRGRNSLFARVQPLLVMTLIQVFGVAFNVAVAGALLFLVVFSDLTFSWGTTIQVEPEQVHRVTSVLSAPWAGILPQARPSLELVEGTRFVRMDGAFAGGEPDAARRAGGWWPFLLVSTIIYGLLPRLLAFVAVVYLLRREMRRALLRSEEVLALQDRLRMPLVAVDPDRVKEPERSGGAPLGESVPAPLERGLDLAVVLWAYDEAPSEEIIARMLEERVGATAVGRFSAGGVDTPEATVLERVKEATARHEIKGAAVFFEPFEPPKADARRFLTRLREALGPSLPIVVFLAEFAGDKTLPVDEEDFQGWRRALQSMGDPYLLSNESRAAS